MGQYHNGVSRFLFLIAFSVVFLVYSFLSFTSVNGAAVRLNSPDETANYFFSRTFAERGTIGYTEPLLSVSKGVVHPRSMTTAGDKVVPVGFMGLAVLYGAIGKIVGSYGILFITPFLAVLAALLFYHVLRRLFDRRTAGLSAVLLLIHPAYWYYASRGMLPNILFVDLLLIAALFFCFAYEQKKIRWFLATGVFVGLALTVRLSEIVWVVFGAVILFAATFRRWGMVRFLSFAIGAIIPLVVLLQFNAHVYGHPLIFGYQTASTYESVSALDRTLALIRTFSPDTIPELQVSIADLFTKAQSYMFPFGFNPPVFQDHFQTYGIRMFWWFSLLSGLGLLVVLRKGLISYMHARDSRLLFYLFATGAIGFWLVAFYGSWVFYDNISEEITIGNSYVRYWLPLYIMSIPLAAAPLSFVLERVCGRAVRTLVVASCVALLTLFSGQTVLATYRDSLFAVAENIKAYQRSAQWIAQHTPEGAVIFSERSDKNFFPERKVAQSFKDFAEKDLSAALVDHVPVYYYGFWNTTDAEYISRHYFTDFGMHWEYIADFANNERLYRLEKNDAPIW